MSETVKVVTFDLEWIALIKEAKELGISKGEVKEFLSEKSS